MTFQPTSWLGPGRKGCGYERREGRGMRRVRTGGIRTDSRNRKGVKGKGAQRSDLSNFAFLFYSQKDGFPWFAVV